MLEQILRVNSNIESKLDLNKMEEIMFTRLKKLIADWKEFNKRMDKAFAQMEDIDKYFRTGGK